MNYFLKLSYSCKKKKSLTWHVMQRWQKIIEKSMLLYTRYHKGNKRKIVPDQPSTAIKQRWWGIEHFLIDNNHKSKQENWQILLQGWARGDPGVTRKHAKAAKLVYIAEERRAWMALLHKIQKRTNGLRLNVRINSAFDHIDLFSSRHLLLQCFNVCGQLFSVWLKSDNKNPTKCEHVSQQSIICK